MRALGQSLKQQGQQLALFGAGAAWAEDAIDALERFCVQRKLAGQSEFRFEQFREHALAHGLMEPTTHKVWGALPRIAVKRGLIQSTKRYEPATSAATHSHPVRVWRAL